MGWFKRWKQKQRKNNTLIFRLYHVFKREPLYYVSKFETTVQAPYNAFQQYGKVPIEKANYFEIGVGAYLESLVGLSLAGMKSCVGVDIERLATVANIKATLNFYREFARQYGLQELPVAVEKVNCKNLVAKLAQLNIEYRAPYALTNKKWEGTFDYLSANYVLEHVPVPELLPILTACYCLLKPGGVFYVNIDYNDHCIYVDAGDFCKIKPSERNRYHYLQYSPIAWDDLRQWEKVGNFYQNRLRTRDYLHLFQQVGFVVLKTEPWPSNVNDERDLRKVVVDPYFAKYTDQELRETGCVYILSK